MKNYLATLLSLVLLCFAMNTQAEVEDPVELTQAELEQILAPVALYPDSVLTHILIAATYPLEVVQANRWVTKNPDLPPAEAMEKVDKEEWDPSVKALIPFPTILQRLSDDLNWTQKLGDAFLQDESRVLDAIQSLRQKADKAGNLSKMDNVKIVREEKIIVLEPAEPEIIYVPYYDTRVVYGHWYWDHYPPVYWHYPHYSHHHHGPFYWHRRVHVSSGFYFSAFHWHNHHIVVLDRHHYRDRRYYRRSEIIRHTYVNRWEHNPNHRRGVAYRNNQVRERYNSIRPSREHTRTVRQNERELAVQRQVNQNSDRASNANRSNNNTLQATRQQRLREQLSERENERQVVRRDSDNRRVEQQDINRSNSDRTNNVRRNNDRVDRQVNQREIDKRVENSRQDVVPRQDNAAKDDSRRVNRDDRREQRNSNEVVPKRENQSRQEREQPVKREQQQRQTQARQLQSRQLETERHSSRANDQYSRTQREDRVIERQSSNFKSERSSNTRNERRAVQIHRTERDSSQNNSRANRRSDDRR